MAEPVDANTAISIDAHGRVHVAAIKAILEPAAPGLTTSTSCGRAHLANLDISVAARLTAQR